MQLDAPFGRVDRDLPGFPTCWSELRHEGPVVRALPAFKDDDRVDLLPVLAPVLRRSIRHVMVTVPLVRAAAEAGQLAVICAPSSAASLRTRGRRPLHDLARQALRGWGLAPASAATLCFRRKVRDQGGLGVADRATNLAGSMVARGVGGRVCLLLDDVVTTGATLAEAGWALREAGAPAVVAATLSAAVLRHP